MGIARFSPDFFPDSVPGCNRNEKSFRDEARCCFREGRWFRHDAGGAERLRFGARRLRAGNRTGCDGVGCGALDRRYLDGHRPGTSEKVLLKVFPASGLGTHQSDG